MQVSITPDDALIVVDVQNDFCPGGALAVPDGDKVVPTLNEYIERFQRDGQPVIATRDWHPNNHTSFEEQGGRWPPHCVQGTEGAQYHPELDLPDGTHHVKKADERDKEAYSGFDKTGLADWLNKHQIRRLFVGGLATDYCVKQTVLDGLEEGFTVFLLEDAIEGIDAEPGDIQDAVHKMLEQGAVQVSLDEVR